DGSNSGAIGLTQQKKYLTDFVMNLAPHISLGLAQINASGDYEITQDFTLDHSALQSAIKQMKGTVAGYEDKRAKISTLSNTWMLDGNPRNAQQVVRLILKQCKTFADEEKARGVNTLRSLNNLFSKMRHVPGEKRVLLLSEGVDPTGSFYYNYTSG